jgi:hypothetical protein
MKGLKDNAEIIAAEISHAVRGHAMQWLASHLDAPRTGLLHARKDHHKGGFPRTRWPDQANLISRIDG